MEPFQLPVHLGRRAFLKGLGTASHTTMARWHAPFLPRQERRSSGPDIPVRPAGQECPAHLRNFLAGVIMFLLLLSLSRSELFAADLPPSRPAEDRSCVCSSDSSPLMPIGSFWTRCSQSRTGRDVFEIESPGREASCAAPRRGHRLGRQLVPEALLPLRRFVVRRPAAPARPACPCRKEVRSRTSLSHIAISSTTAPSATRWPGGTGRNGSG